MDFSNLPSLSDIYSGTSNLMNVWNDAQDRALKTKLADLNGQYQVQSQQLQLDLAKAQGNNALRYANAGFSNPFGFSSNTGNIDQSLSNLGTMFNASNGTNNMMMYLTMAGVLLALFQLVKK